MVRTMAKRDRATLSDGVVLCSAGPASSILLYGDILPKMDIFQLLHKNSILP